MISYSLQIQSLRQIQYKQTISIQLPRDIVNDSMVNSKNVSSILHSNKDQCVEKTNAHLSNHCYEPINERKVNCTAEERICDIGLMISQCFILANVICLLYSAAVNKLILLGVLSAIIGTAGMYNHIIYIFI